MIDETESMWNSDGSLKQLQPKNSGKSLIEEQFPQDFVSEETIEEEPQETAPVEQPVIAAEKPKERSSDLTENMYRLRKRTEELEYERDQLRQQLSQIQKKSEDFNLSLNDDDLAEGRHLTKVAQKVRQLEEQLNQTAMINQQIMIEQRLKSKHADFDAVVTKDNLERLRDEYPEILNTILSAQDMYAQGVTAYTMIKKLGIAPDLTAPLARIAQNTSKPRSANSVAGQSSSTALSRAGAFGDLTPEMKKALLKEMADAASRA